MHFPLWQILVLAAVQGLTEFLPISSDGHLSIVAALFALGSTGTKGMEVSDLIIMLHGGTLLSILVFYWQRIRELLRDDWRTVRLLGVATVPAVVIGLPAKIFAERWLTDPLLTGGFLIATGSILLLAERLPRGEKTYREMTYWQAFWLGVAQAAAILPGLSRSGSTITAALKMGFQPRAAATFSFLMAIPVIGGACVLELATVLRHGRLESPWQHLILGVVVAFSVGLVALSWLVRWLERGKFSRFAWWCIPVGVIVLVWQLTCSSF